MVAMLGPQSLQPVSPDGPKSLQEWRHIAMKIEVFCKDVADVLHLTGSSTWPNERIEKSKSSPMVKHVLQEFGHVLPPGPTVIPGSLSSGEPVPWLWRIILSGRASRWTRIPTTAGLARCHLLVIDLITSIIHGHTT